MGTKSPSPSCVQGACSMAEAKPSLTARIGIVTVTYNSESVLPEFLDSLSAQTWRDFTLYAVDNRSKDHTLAIVRGRTNLPIVVIANEENLGVAEGNNQGIRAALADGCDCILLLNNDTVFPPDLLERLYGGLEQCGCEMTTAKMYYYDQPTRIWCAGGSFQPWLAYRARHAGLDEEDRAQFDRPRRVTYSPTCCLLIRAEVFDRVGMMDSRYFVYFDDVDFLYRCLKQGVSLWYIPEAKLWHKVASLTGSDISKFSLHYAARNKAYFIVKNIPRLHAFLPSLLFETYFRVSTLRPDPAGQWYRIKLAAWKEGKRMMQGQALRGPAAG
jgi:GT2 family glycosyltransferase